MICMECLLTALTKNKLELVWFVDHYINKNPLNEGIKNDDYPRKSRKYLVYLENGVFKATKFWEAQFTNRRDNEIENDKSPFVDLSKFNLSDDNQDK